MKRGGLFLAIILLALLSIPIGFSINFTGSTPVRLDSTLSPVFQAGYPNRKFSAFFFNDTWFVGIGNPHSAQNHFNVSRWSNDFSSMLTGWTQMSGSGSAYGDSIIQYYNTTHGIAWVDHGATARELGYFQYSNLAYSQIWSNSESYVGGCGEWKYTDSSVDTGVIVLMPNNCNERYWNYDSSTSASLYATATYDNNIRGLSLTYGNDGHYYLFFIYDNGVTETPFLNVYSSPEFIEDNYVTSQAVSSGGETNISDISSTLGSGGSLYLAYNLNNSQVYNQSSDPSAVRINMYGINDDHTLTILESDDIVPPNVDNSANRTVSPYLYYSDFYGSFYLFYDIFNVSNSAFLGSWVVQEDICVCGSWYNTSECVGNYRKQIRYCSPDLCLAETNYTYDSYCSLDLNRTLGIYEQGYEYISNTSRCESDWVDVGEDAICYTNLQIHPNCNSSITVFSHTAGDIDGDKDSGGNFNIASCLPPSDCESNTYSCEYLENSTYMNYIRNDTTLTAGEIVVSKHTFRTDLGCEDKGWYDNSGLERYRVYGNLHYTCQIACQEEWFCVDDYETALKRIDCTFSNYTTCQYGCEDGACLSEVPPTEDDTHPISIPFWIRVLNGNLTSGERFIGSIGLSLMLGMFVTLFVGSRISLEGNSQIVIFALGLGCGLILFTSFGWLSKLWIVVLGFIVIGGIAFTKLK